METNNRSQREKILRNFISGSEFAAIRISSVVGDQNDIFYVRLQQEICN